MLLGETSHYTEFFTRKMLFESGLSLTESLNAIDSMDVHSIKEISTNDSVNNNSEKQDIHEKQPSVESPPSTQNVIEAVDVDKELQKDPQKDFNLVEEMDKLTEKTVNIDDKAKESRYSVKSVDKAALCLEKITYNIIHQYLNGGNPAFDAPNAPSADSR